MSWMVWIWCPSKVIEYDPEIYESDIVWAGDWLHGGLLQSGWIGKYGKLPSMHYPFDDDLIGLYYVVMIAKRGRLQCIGWILLALPRHRRIPVNEQHLPIISTCKWNCDREDILSMMWTNRCKRLDDLIGLIVISYREFASLPWCEVWNW